MVESLTHEANISDEPEDVCSDAVNGIDGTSELIRSVVLLGLEELSLQRSQMRNFVVETIERNIYRNIHGPILDAKRISLKVGDMCVWRKTARNKIRNEKGKVVGLGEKSMELINIEHFESPEELLALSQEKPDGLRITINMELEL